MGGKQRIMALYQTQPDRNLRAKALAKEYGVGGHSHDFLDGSRGSVSYTHLRKEMVATIQRITRKEKSENPPPLYDLTTLQRDANRLLGYSAQQTLDYVQRQMCIRDRRRTIRWH